MADVYSTDCSFCAGAKDLLSKRGIAFEEINLAKDPEGRAALLERTRDAELPPDRDRRRGASAASASRSWPAGSELSQPA